MSISILDEVKKLMLIIDNDSNYMEYNVSVEVICAIEDDWSFWKFSRELLKLDILPNKNIEHIDDVISCSNKIKASQGNEKIVYTLLFIAIKNRIVRERIEGLIYA